MAELDAEMLERVQRWCAEAGRRTAPSEIRAALEPLGWDELLNVRALLADPPPAIPLGPFALADLARGAPADVAAERERQGRYRPEVEPAPAGAVEAEPGARSPAPRAGAGRPRRGPRRPAMPVVHRKRDQAPPEPQPAAQAPSIEELRQPSGRGVLERLLRKQGARRSFLLAGLSGWRRPDGAAPTDEDLDALLDLHGLAHAFAHRERDELLHALRAARGERGAAAARVGLTPEAYQASLDRLGAGEEAERIRTERRAELRGRATLAERCRMLLEEPDRLADLGLLAEVEEDLKARFPGHLRALRSGEPGIALQDSFARSLGLPPAPALALAARLELDLGSAAGAPAAGPPSRPRGREIRTPAPGGGRPPRRGGPRTGGPDALRRGGPRPGGRGGPRPGGMARSGGPRPGGMARPGGPRPGGMARPGGPRPGGMARSGGPRPGGMARPAGGAARPGSARPPRTGGPRKGPPRRPGARPGSAAPRTGRPSGPPRPRGGRPGKPRPR